MTATGKHETTGRKAGALGALTLAAAILALAAAGIWHWQASLTQPGSLHPPTERIRHDPEALARGLDAFAARHESPNHHEMFTTTELGDIQPWLAHLDNIAAHQGWYIPSKGQNTRNLIIPGGDLQELRAARDNPYGWLEAYRPPEDARAKPLAPGRYPAYVRFRVEQNVPVWSIPLIIGSVLTAAAGIYTGALAAMNLARKGD